MEYLTKEQRKSMEARLAALEVSRASLSESLAEEIKGFKVGSGDSVSTTVVHARETLYAIEKSIQEHRNILSRAVEPVYDSEKVDIGTKFSAALSVDGKVMEDNYVLVQTNPNFDAEYKQISISSPIGKAVYGKKENEVFEYLAPAGVFKGVITSIVKENVKEETKEVGKQKTIGTHPQAKKGK